MHLPLSKAVGMRLSPSPLSPTRKHRWLWWAHSDTGKYQGPLPAPLLTDGLCGTVCTSQQSQTLNVASSNSQQPQLCTAGARAATAQSRGYLFLQALLTSPRQWLQMSPGLCATDSCQENLQFNPSVLEQDRSPAGSTAETSAHMPRLGSGNPDSPAPASAVLELEAGGVGVLRCRVGAERVHA